MAEFIIIWGIILIIFNKFFVKIGIKFNQLLYLYKYNEETIKRHRIIGIFIGVFLIIFGLIIKIIKILFKNYI